MQTTERDTGDQAAGSSFDLASVQAALAVAVRAPSIHNTQPWRWELRGDGLALLADRTRQLSVADPDGHSLMLSCGAALTLTELGLRAQGWQVGTVRFPDDADPDLLALLRPTGREQAGEADSEQAEVALRRRSDRRPFAPGQLGEDVIEQLRAATDGPGAHVHFPVREEEKTNLAVAVSWADRIERNDAAYVEEMTSWLRDTDVHADGVTVQVVPHVEEGHPRRTSLPVRDFEVGVTGSVQIEHDVDEHPLLAVILTATDTPGNQLAAGEAMMRLMLRAEALGVACCPLSQAVDLLAFRARLQTLMAWTGFPQMMLRMGRPPAGDAPPLTPRRPVADVLRVI